LAALAAVLALEPAILVLDEPTTGLDPRWRRSLAQVLETLPIQSLIVASHDLQWIGKTTHRALILSHGRIREDRPTAELLGDRALLESYDLPLDY
jgi:cobalt/nickel transport system ATP-binding protein